MSLALEQQESAIKRKSGLWILLFVVIFGAFNLRSVSILVLLALLLILLAFLISLLLLFFRFMRLNKSESGNEGNETIKSRKWNLYESMSFSSAVFLSGTKLFVDPPTIPKLQGVSISFTKRIFIVERLLGALFSILFFLALTGIVIKPV